MIPLRVSLRGFLCYVDEQEISFDGSSLWLLAGLNGSGKSAVFDAVTYALFGSHRAGTLHAQELVNKDSDGLQVEFDFSLGEHQYRIKRTLRRSGRPTQQIFRHIPSQNGRPGKWEPVPETGTRDGFQNWVRDNIGLTHETFTSSVLLRQGQAEKLLDSQPRDRFKVLAGIVDLGRFQRLHEKADDKRRQLKEQSEILENQLKGLADVTEEELAAADQQVTAAVVELEQARTEVERLQRLHVQAERWADLQDKLSEARQRWERAQSLLAEAEAIGRDAARLRELREVLPHARAVIEQRDRLVQSEQLTKQLRTGRHELDRQRQQLDHALDQGRQKRDRLQRDLVNDQEREKELAVELSGLDVLLDRIYRCEKQQQEKAQVLAELAKLPLEPTAKVEREQQEYDKLLALHQALPHLSQLVEKRTELRRAIDQLREAAETEKTVTASGLDLKAREEALAPQAEAATRARQQAETQATAARTRWEEADKQLQQLSELTGAKRCRVCGQELSPEHVELERQGRQKLRAEAGAAARQAEETRQAVVAEEGRLLQSKKELEEQRLEARHQLQEYRRRKAEAERDVGRYQADCLRVYVELAEPFRSRVATSPPADWSATTFPAETDVQESRRQALGLGAVQKRLKQVQEVANKWRGLQVQLDTVQRLLDSVQVGVPKDVTTPRHRHAILKAEESDLKVRLKTLRTKLTEEEKEAERLGREREGVLRLLAGKDQQLKAEEVRREACQETLTRARSVLPEAWQSRCDPATAADWQQWQEELNVLTRSGAETRAQELRQVREGLESQRQRLADLEREQEQIPTEARCQPDQVQELLTTARREQTGREASLRQAQSAKERLVERQRQRQELQQQSLEADRLHNRYRLLTDLLGPKRLQLHLLRQAERGIVQFANAVLDRVSGGQLYLRLRGQDAEEEASDQALRLEAYNRNSGQTPIDVSFLSGSQRFRVAVSLALGIGQYASRQHRPIESVIIDEGFGCLDRHGRQTMIEELRALRGELRCILLVSHQEEFADAFADGYHFELASGSTRVRRFQR